MENARFSKTFQNTLDLSQKRIFPSFATVHPSPNVTARFNTSITLKLQILTQLTTKQTRHVHKTLRLRGETHHLFSAKIASCFTMQHRHKLTRPPRKRNLKHAPRRQGGSATPRTGANSSKQPWAVCGRLGTAKPRPASTPPTPRPPPLSGNPSLCIRENRRGCEKIMF